MLKRRNRRPSGWRAVIPHCVAMQIVFCDMVLSSRTAFLGGLHPNTIVLSEVSNCDTA